MKKPVLVVDNPSPVKAPAAPSSLGPAGRAEWRKVASILAKNGGLTPENETLLVLYCQAVEGAQDAAKILKKQGRTIKGPNGTAKGHPMIRAEAVYLQNALRYAAELGLIGRAGRTSRPNVAPSSVFD